MRLASESSRVQTPHHSKRKIAQLTDSWSWLARTTTGLRTADTAVLRALTLSSWPTAKGLAEIVCILKALPTCTSSKWAKTPANCEMQEQRTQILRCTTPNKALRAAIFQDKLWIAWARELNYTQISRQLRCRAVARAFTFQFLSIMQNSSG